MDCLFCKIISREIPSDILFENDYLIAFNDIHPVTPVHILVVPKIHIESVNNVSQENSIYVAKIFEAISEIAKAAGIYEGGYRVISNIGENGGQNVKHLHFHILGGTKLGAKIV